MIYREIEIRFNYIKFQSICYRRYLLQASESDPSRFDRSFLENIKSDFCDFVSKGKFSLNSYAKP